MRMLNKLLDSVNRSWNQLPKDTPVMSIERASGQHTLVSVDSSQLYLHSTAFRSDMPSKQAVYLDDYTLAELVDVLNSMGYRAVASAEAQAAGLLAKKAFTLMEVCNIPMTADPATLTAFTSPLWELLYPIARLLTESERNVGLALQQMIAPAASGRWLDYWATFFKVKRVAGESDKALARRTLMSLVNMKTNNIALKELLEYQLQSPVEVRDVEPALFSLDIDADLMQSYDVVRAIIESVKAGGVDFLTTYMKRHVEDYRLDYGDRTGVSFEQSAVLSSKLDWKLIEYKYGYEIDGGLTDVFVLDTGVLDGNTHLLGAPVQTMTDAFIMRMTRPDGTVVRE